MSNPFGKIKTADELDKAILSVKASQKALGTGISKDARFLLDSMKPANLANHFISGLLPASITLSDVGIGLVHGLKKILSAPGKAGRKKSLKKPEPETPEEAEVATAEE